MARAAVVKPSNVARSSVAPASGCPVCLAAAEQVRRLEHVAPPEWLLGECSRCGFVYLANPPNYQTLREDFAWQETFTEERERRRRRRSRLESSVRAPLRHGRRFLRGLVRYHKFRGLCRAHLREGTILDLGAGRGRPTAACLPAAAVPLGIEIQSSRAEEARQRFEPLGGQVIVAPVLRGLEGVASGSAAGAIARNYLEHETRPRDVLSELFRTLEAGAAVVIKVPNHGSLPRRFRGANWCGYRFPDHVNYFTPDTLTRLLTETGFVSVRVGIVDRIGVSNGMWCVARKPAGSGARLTGLAKAGDEGTGGDCRDSLAAAAVSVHS